MKLGLIFDKRLKELFHCFGELDTDKVHSPIQTTGRYPNFFNNNIIGYDKLTPRRSPKQKIN